ncbi:uncharacterized protein LOC115620518 [Scaptodrosophila lebanonensis]|uniref:Uncharacterized protein LOC115620518 n=1 Tax=Drosophila lebanonensis TaxID=7225 RepID=A0A6J2T0W3_DROLE|nr:uncharacterized protein LOC115620518 [Scaptodrosophila lebanonensis]
MDDVRALDHNEVFHQLSTEIKDFNQSTKKLKNMRYWSGNEIYIEKLCERVLNVLLEHNLVEQVKSKVDPDELIAVPKSNASLDNLRGTLVFLILNSDNTYFCELDELRRYNPHYVHLMELCPPLPLIATVAIAQKCGLEEPLKEFLSCGPYWLTKQYYEICNEAFNYVESKDKVLERVCGVLDAARGALNSYALRGGPGPTDADWEAANTGLLSNVAQLLQRHILASDEQLRQSLRPQARKRYLGKATMRLMQVLLKALDPTQHNQRTKLPVQFFVLCSPHADPSTNLHDKQAMLRKFANQLLNTLQNLLMHVSVDTFMYWQELPSGVLLFTMQEHICNLVHKLLPLLEADEELSTHSIKQQLVSVFEGGVKTFEHSLSELPLGDLLALLDGDMGQLDREQSLAAINELFQRPIAFGNEECVETMARNGFLLNISHAERILKHLDEVVRAKQAVDVDDSDNEEMSSVYDSLLSLVLRPLFKSCKNMQKIELLIKRDSLQLLSHFNFAGPDCNSKRILFFNNANCQIGLSRFLMLCYDQPQATWLSLAQLAMTHKYFDQIYWRLARICKDHAAFYVGHIVSELVTDRRMIHNVNGKKFLLSLYNFLIKVNSIRSIRQQIVRRSFSSRIAYTRRVKTWKMTLYPQICGYNAEKLQAMQKDYLEAFAVGLAKFRDTDDCPSLGALLKILRRTCVADDRVKNESENELMKLRKYLSIYENSSNSTKEITAARRTYEQAEEYVRIHEELRDWRCTNWAITSQVMLTVDHLRWNLNDFNMLRVRALTSAVLYASENIPNIALMPAGFLRDIDALVRTFRYKSFWTEAASDLMGNLGTKPTPQQLNLYVELLIQSSVNEARTLMMSAVRAKCVRPVMCKLSEAVINAGTETAIEAYHFIFKCYADAFQKHQWPFKSYECANHAEDVTYIVLKSPPLSLPLIMETVDLMIIKLYTYADKNGKVKIKQLASKMPQAPFAMPQFNSIIEV